MAVELPRKIVFCDFDGVLTSKHETPGSYVNWQSEYGVSPSCFDRLEELCTRTSAKVIVSSNWRRFEDYGRWSYCAFDGVHMFKNPLPKLKSMLGKLHVGDLPKDRGLNKSQALCLWFQQHPEFNGKYVVFDDDPRELLHCTDDYGIKDHYIQTDAEWGLQNSDVERAVEILSR